MIRKSCKFDFWTRVGTEYFVEFLVRVGRLSLFTHFSTCLPVHSLNLSSIFEISPACLQARNGIYTVGDFMTRKEELQVVKPTTTVDEGILECSSNSYTKILLLHLQLFLTHCFRPTALEALVKYRITGFPVIDNDWKLVRLSLISL